MKWQDRGRRPALSKKRFDEQPGYYVTAGDHWRCEVVALATPEPRRGDIEVEA